MKIVCVSDTHNKLGQFKVPDGDVLIHAGDATGLGTIPEIVKFNRQLGELPHRVKIFVPGNHDWLFQSSPALAIEIMTSCRVLIDASTEVEGINIYGSPWTPEFFNWAFMKKRGQEIRKVWDRIPKELDILITHGPPAGILDTTYHGDGCGCEELALAVNRTKPRFHVFGHIHSSSGRIKKEDTTYINASLLDDFYFPTYLPAKFSI